MSLHFVPTRRFAPVFCGIAVFCAANRVTHGDPAAPVNLVVNPTLQDADGDGVPDKWRSSAPTGKEELKVQADAANGVKIVDQDKGNGVGLAQYVAVEPGHKYKFTASVKGSGGLWVYLQFLDRVPAREGDISKHRLTELRESTSASADFKEFTVQATAPAQAKQARVWFYCPKIGVTDSTVKNAALVDLGADPAGVPAAAPAAATPLAPVVTTATTTLANPDLTDADGDKLPDDWRIFPSADGTGTQVLPAAGGGFQIVDTDKNKGIGIQQQLPAQAGASYSFSATLKGTAGIWLNFQFLKDKPARDSDLKSVLISSERISAKATPEGKESTLTATAPADTKFMRVWLYSPSIGVTDVTVVKARLDTGTALVTAATPLNDKLLFVGDFESGNFEGWQTQFPHSTKGEIVQSPVRAGKYAIRNDLTYEDFKTYGDSRNRRSEIYHENVGRPGEERWYGFSVYLPKDWENEMFDIVMQIHNHPDPGEGAKSPIMTLETEGKNWKVNDRFDREKISKPANHGAGGTITSNRLWEGPYEVEKWTDWVFHVKWSLDDDGLIEAWKDGVKVVEHKGPNGYNDEQPYYMKIGVYKPAYRVTAPPHRVIYHDEVRIGNEKASYADVAPPAVAK